MKDLVEEQTQKRANVYGQLVSSLTNGHAFIHHAVEVAIKYFFDHCELDFADLTKIQKDYSQSWISRHNVLGEK